MNTTDTPAAVYVQTNETSETASPPTDAPTNGGGDGVAHLTSQGSVVLARDRRHLLVTNASSGDVSLSAGSEPHASE